MSRQTFMEIVCASIMVLFLFACMASLVGCTTPERWLTQEEDAALKEKCGEGQCVILPVDLYQQMIEALKGNRI